MVGMGLGLGLAIEGSGPGRGGGGAAPVPTPLMPPNWDFIAFGDSRTENALSARLAGEGYEAVSANLGPAAWLPSVSGNRLRLARYPNYGISSSTSEEGSAIPRRSASGGATAGAVVTSSPERWFRGGDSQNKGADRAAASGAGVVLFLYGTNDNNRNANTQYATTSRTNVLTMLDTLSPTQLKVVFNETPKGFRSDGGDAGQVTSPAFSSYAAWLKTLDHASGSPNARPDVVVVDSWAETLDPGTGRNRPGYLRDGLHFTPWGARRLAEMAHARLTAVYGTAYAGLPSRAELPVSNGATIAADAIGAVHGGFVHTNPLLTPGGSGAVQGGNFGTAPAAAAVPQGWVVSGQGIGNGIAVTVDKSGTDPDGYPMTTLAASGTLKGATFTAEIGGTTLTVTAVSAGAVEVGQTVNYGAAGAVTITALGTGTGGVGTYTINFAPGTVASQTMTAGGTYTLQLYQQARQAGQLAITDKVRGVAHVRTETGSQQLQRVQLRCYVQEASATRSQSAIAMSGSAGGIGDRAGYVLNANGYDAGGQHEVLLTQLLDLQDPNMATANGGPGTVASIGNCICYVEATFANFTGTTRPVSATVRVSRTGVYKA